MSLTHMTLSLFHSHLKTLKVDSLLRKPCWVSPTVTQRLTSAYHYILSTPSGSLHFATQ